VKKFLIKVEDVFELKGRGLILVPSISVENDLPKSAAVLMIQTDKSEMEAQADFEIPFIWHLNVEDYSKRQPAYVILLKGLTKAEVPLGTEIWLK
jgi:hypothetical protein